jgi:hypothetical protein
MSLRILCPNGHELVAEIAHIGRKIRCPACKVVMVVPDPNPQVTGRPPPRPPQQPAQQPAPQPAPGPRRAPNPQVTAQPPRPRRQQVEEEPQAYEEPEPEPAEEEYRPKKGMKTRQRMRLANIGLGFHYAKVLCILVALVLILVSMGLGFMAGLARSMGMLRAVSVLSCISNILFLVTPVLGAVGSLLCFWLPPKSNSKVLAIVTFSLEVGGVALIGIAFLMALSAPAVAADEMMGGRGPRGGMALAGGAIILILLGALVIYASFIMFLIVLRVLAGFLRDFSTADEAMRALIMYVVVTVGGAVVVFGLSFILLGGEPNLGKVILLLAVMVGWIVALCVVMFAILTVIGTVRARINSRY